MATWYYRRGDHESPGLQPDQMRALAAKGELTPDTLIRKANMDGYVKASEVDGLFDQAVLTTTPPASSVSGPGAATISPVGNQGPAAELTGPQVADVYEAPTVNPFEGVGANNHRKVDAKWLLGALPSIRFYLYLYSVPQLLMVPIGFIAVLVIFIWRQINPPAVPSVSLPDLPPIAWLILIVVSVINLACGLFWLYHTWQVFKVARHLGRFRSNYDAQEGREAISLLTWVVHAFILYIVFNLALYGLFWLLTSAIGSAMGRSY